MIKTVKLSPSESAGLQAWIQLKNIEIAKVTKRFEEAVAQILSSQPEKIGAAAKINLDENGTPISISWELPDPPAEETQ